MKIIGIEEHFLNNEIAAATTEAIEKAAPGLLTAFRPIPGEQLSKVMSLVSDLGAKRIADMDEHGIDVQVLSYNAPGTQVLTAKEAVPLAIAANDALALAVKAYPDRFAGFATLPTPDPIAAAKELERCVKEFGFKGAMINGNTNGRFLDEPELEPILAKAAELEVPLYIHPTLINKTVRDAYYGNLDETVSARFASTAWGWHNETGIHVIRLILAGVFDKYPNLQIIIGHWGEMIPFFLSRTDKYFPKVVTHLKKDFKEYVLGNIYVTPSGLFDLPQFKNTLEVMGEDRIMYSIDFPFYENKGARAFLENAPISQEAKEKIAHGNAEKLLKL